MTTIPTITEQDIRSHVGDTSFQRGQQYFRNGAIFNARRQGRTLKARCEGSRSEAYHVEVTFDEENIVDTNCSCPIGGSCKHIAALLLTWLDRPEEFSELEDMDTSLEQRSKAELIALIKLMLRKEPELEWLLEIPQPTAEKSNTPINAETYRRQVEAAFRHGGDRWDAVYGIASELGTIKHIADQFARQQDYASAMTIYEQLVIGVIENYSLYPDEEGTLASLLSECSYQLGDFLANVQDNKAVREKIMHILFEIYSFDVKAGDFGISDRISDILLSQTSIQERLMVASWIRNVLSQIEGNEWSDQFHRQWYGAFLLELEAETLDDEAFLQICRETNRSHDLVDRLLTLERVNEALTEAQRVSDYDLLRIGDIFVEHGHEALAEQIMQERSRHSEDTRLLDWLKKYHLSRNNLPAALELAINLFHKQPPALAYYQEIRQLARELDRWETVRAQLIDYLEKSQHASLLIQIALDEADIDKAIEMVKSEQKRRENYRYGFGYSYGYGTNSIALEVAKAAEQSRPRAALEIYQQVAERLIDQRGRGNYQEACNYLTRVRELYARLGESEEWTQYINHLRESNRSLRALKEELAAAKL